MLGDLDADGAVADGEVGGGPGARGVRGGGEERGDDEAGGAAFGAEAEDDVDVAVAGDGEHRQVVADAQQARVEGRGEAAALAEAGPRAGLEGAARVGEGRGPGGAH
nr:hypothetical protein GCM10025732_42570 [Glycomyces mayteni]